MRAGPGIEPGPQRWAASALPTAPSLLPMNCIRVKTHHQILRSWKVHHILLVMFFVHQL